MNAIDDNDLTRMWKTIANALPKPEAILSISAHWYGRNNRIQSARAPRQIYDMYGFPEPLYDVTYEPQGDPRLTQAVLDLLSDDVSVDDEWGIDHGTWSVLCHMYPDASIPVVQLSINMALTGMEILHIGKRLAPLREQGILILGSGNIVHNLRQIVWDMEGGVAEAEAFDRWIYERVMERDVNALADIESNPLSRFAVPTSDHFLPLLYCLGAMSENDKIDVFNRQCMLGSLSMTSYRFG